MATVDDVRRIALGLPDTTEQSSYGTPGFRVRNRLFARLREDDDVLVVWTADEGEKQSLLAADPAVFFTTAHYDGHASVLVRLPVVAPTELAELLTEAWRVRASARLRRDFDSRQVQ